MKTMDNHTPHFPLFSILLGMIMGAGSYIVENSFIVAHSGLFSITSFQLLEISNEVPLLFEVS